MEGDLSRASVATATLLADFASVCEQLTGWLIEEAAALRSLDDTIWASASAEMRPFRFVVEASGLTLLDDHATIQALIHAARDDDAARFLVVATEHGVSYTASHEMWGLFRRTIDSEG
jgi:hypothetical protein